MADTITGALIYLHVHVYTIYMYVYMYMSPILGTMIWANFLMGPPTLVNGFAHLPNPKASF